MADAPDTDAAFVLELGRALHAYGTPAHRLEEVLARVARTLGLEGQFYATPTALLAGFGKATEARTALLRVAPGGIDLEKLERLDAVVARIIDGHLDAEAGVARVREIVAAPPPYGKVATVLAFAVASGAVTRFFHGGLRDLLTAAVIGAVIGALSLGLGREGTGARVYELVAGFAAAFIAHLAARLAGPVGLYVATLSGLIILVPGFTLTVAMAELATRNLVSGTARLTAAGIVFLQLALGVAAGEKVARALFGPVAQVSVPPLPAWTEAMAVAVTALALTVFFQARLKRLGWILAACALAYYGARVGTALLGPALGAFIGGFGVAAASNAFARRFDRPALVPLTPGFILLVPGSLGFQSL